MPDEHGNDSRTDEPTETSLHAYRDGREEDIVGDVDKLESGDPQESQRAEIADDQETVPAPPNPEKA